MSDQQPKKRIQGVFSSQEVRKVGTGTTTRKTVSKIFWFVEQTEGENTVLIQAINTNYIPTGAPKTITMEELLERYSPEPEFYIQSVYPNMQKLEDSISKAEDSRKKGEIFTAEYEYNNALKLDEENIRANFGIGLTYLAQGEGEKADNIFERLVNLNATFEKKHKHLFNEFGINLRKSKMYKQASDYYTRALELSATDENIHINIARVLLEQKDYSTCVEHLVTALNLTPGNITAIKFLTWLKEKKLLPQEQQESVTKLLQQQPKLDIDNTNSEAP